MKITSPCIVISLILVFLVITLTPLAAVPNQVPPDSVRIERLTALAKLWGAVKYFHPYLAYRDIDWDAALIEAIPKVRAASSAEEYAAALQSMLDALGDPATRIVRKKDVNIHNEDGDHPISTRWTGDNILVVTIPGLTDFSIKTAQLRAIGNEIPKARGILFDLRAGALPENSLESYVFDSSGIASKLSSVPINAPSQRTRVHSGFMSQDEGSSGGYYSAFQISDGKRFPPSAGAKDTPVVFLINDRSGLPSVALALQDAGRAAIVVEGKASDASAIRTEMIRLSDNLEAAVRRSELIYSDGSGGLYPDAVVPTSEAKGDENAAFQAALTRLRNPMRAAAPRSPLPARAVPKLDKVYSDMLYPSMEYRLLAAFRIWNIIHYFFPYKDLMGEDWDAVLKQFIPRMEAARDALEYALAVAEMVTHVHDSHVSVRSKALSEYFGAASPPVRVRMIEGVPVITDFLDESLAKKVGLEIGDVILKVDGEDVKARIDRQAKYIAASTPQAHMRNVMARLLNGPDQSVASLTIKNWANQIKEVEVPRSREYLRQAPIQRRGEILKMLPGNIGYADLDRLEQSMVDRMFEMFKDTKAIIFDMRGYPKGTAWVIAPRLTERDSVGAAKFGRPFVMSPDPNQWTNYGFMQFLPRTDKWRYKGKTVMLIDERTQSQAEHTGLFFEAANGTKFIGSPTAGANGDITTFSVPGGVRITFTGHDVRHADGRQLQRIGLVPDIEVKPTIAGIRNGKDEVLEKALKYLQGIGKGESRASHGRHPQ